MNVLATLLLASASAASLPFIPDVTFEGSSLQGWHVVGQAEWRAENGELIGKAKDGGGGWLVLDRSFQDVGLHAIFKCSDGCKAGVLVRAEESGNGMKGVFVPLGEGETAPNLVTFDSNGQETAMEELGRSFGIERVADPDAAPPAWMRGGGGFPFPRGPQVELPFESESTDYKPGEWNQIDIIMDANIARSNLNGGRGGIGVTRDNGNGFGPVALYIAGSGEVRFKDVGYKDLAIWELPDEKVGGQFRKQCISDWYYAWSASTADFNRDGETDVVAGAMIHYGPDFNKSREIFLSAALSPTKDFTQEQIQVAHDFTGDGWPDVFVGPSGAWLYINPKGESRRWEKVQVLPALQSEVTVADDLDDDGMPEIVYMAGMRMRYAEPDPANPTGMWIEHDVSEAGYGAAHGIGVGDVNGDGRKDILNPNGWWEQPAAGPDKGPWPYHMHALSRGGAGFPGGAGMFVVDANRDGRNDIVTVLAAHTFGLAWYEQKEDGSFVEHVFMDDFGWDQNAGGVVFSEPHGTGFGDIDGDGVGDFIVGKRAGAHLHTYLDPDPFGDPVLYWYKAVPNPNAPGGAEFVPHLIHNRSGAGSNVFAGDVDKDGDVDVITSTNRGTFIFWNVGKGGAASDD
jgi:hypothetical protein